MQVIVKEKKRMLYECITSGLMACTLEGIKPMARYNFFIHLLVNTDINISFLFQIYLFPLLQLAYLREHLPSYTWRLHQMCMLKFHALSMLDG